MKCVTISMHENFSNIKRERRKATEFFYTQSHQNEMRNKWNSTVRDINNMWWRRRKISFCSVLINIHCLLLITNIVSSTTIVSNSKIDLCTTLCRCANETGIEKIHCDFKNDKVSHILRFLNLSHLPHNPFKPFKV